MFKQHYTSIRRWIELHRFKLLLLATFMTLVLPAFAGNGLFSQLIFVITQSFLFIQSMLVANLRKSGKQLMRFVVFAMIFVIWLQPAGYESIYTEYLKLSLFVLFFLFIIWNLALFVSQSKVADKNVLIASVNIYLLAGIVGASLTFVCYLIYPDAYNLPDYIPQPRFVHFLYYSFITMSTVGYGDITPRIPETQTVAYLISVAGQLYVAIIIAFLIGKYLMHGEAAKGENSKNKP
jgi:hypothetical protein